MRLASIAALLIQPLTGRHGRIIDEHGNEIEVYAPPRIVQHFDR